MPARDENFKGRLQQVAQERFGQTPVYESEGARVGNRREYTSVVFAGPEPLGTGHGANKQEAEQDAARAALETLLEGKPQGKPQGKQQRQARQPRARRPARSRKDSAPAAEAEVIPLLPPMEAALEVVTANPPPEPPREAEPLPEPELPPPPRSRQFGESID